MDYQEAVKIIKQAAREYITLGQMHRNADARLSAAKFRFTHLLTKEQVLCSYAFTSLSEAELIPRRGKKIVVSVPVPNRVLITITRDSHKSTYGKPLFLCVHES